jgi:stringent starvation protein B
MNAPPPTAESQGTSTRPYLIRALHDWCTDNGYTPYIAVWVDDSVQVPREYVKNDEIVLNLGFEATSGLELGNDVIAFKARFGGVAREIFVPVDHVVAIYARENGQGMAFPMPTRPVAGGADDAPAQAPAPTPARPPARAAPAAVRAAPAPRRPRLSRVGADTPPVPPAAGAAHEPDDPQPPRPSLKRIK